MKKLILISLIAIISISCKKKGCMDENALNYDSNAKKDDANCTYPTSLIIKSVSVLGYPSRDLLGDVWDDANSIDSLPDVFLSIQEIDENGSSLDTLLETDPINNFSGTHTWNTSLSISEQDINKSYNIILYDQDSLFGETIAWPVDNTIFDPYNYTQNGYYSEKFPTSVTGLTFDWGFGNTVFTLELEWK